MLGPWIAIVIAGCSSGGAGRVAPEIVAGVESTGDPAVVAITYAEDPASVRCTGTLVGERVVLTAAHCSIHESPSTFEVTIAPRVGRAERRIAILSAVAHPDDAASSADHDLALLLLAEAPMVEPVPLLDAAPATGPARLVGFGQTAAAEGDADRRREGSAEITSVEASHVVIGPAPSLPCHGDSGGPVLVEAPAGPRLAAVVSRGDSSCSDRARATRVDVHLDGFVQPWLEAWEPGSRADGERCLDDELCASGLCVAALDDPTLRFCGAPCADVEACEPGTTCQEGLCRHPTPSPGALGSACATRDDCERGECVEGYGVCSVRCVDACPGDYRCTHVGGIDFYCVPPPAPSCAASRARGSSLPLLLALAVGALSRRRRSR